eukprot:scaffold59039_cov29-Tisochrysis_lutea.AAC.5
MASPISSTRMKRIVIFEMRDLSSLPSADGLYSASSTPCRARPERKSSLITRTMRSNRKSRPTFVPARAMRPARAAPAVSSPSIVPAVLKRGITSGTMEPTATTSSQKKKERM